MSTEESREAGARFAWADRVDAQQGFQDGMLRGHHERLTALEQRFRELQVSHDALEAVIKSQSETLLHIVDMLTRRLDQDH